MSSLNPGGSRNPGGRIFGANNIRRAIQSKKPDHTDASGSIADRPHQASREQQRRLKQQARKKS